MIDLDAIADTGYLGKKFSRAVWSGLTPDARIEMRKEYRFMRRTLGIRPRLASGCILRIVAVCHWGN